MNRKIKVLFICMTVTFMAACGGPSREKIQEVQNVYAQLVERHNEVVEAYAELKDSSLREELDGMAEKINDIGQQDAGDMTNRELDEMKADLQENIASYDRILESVKALKAEEKEIYAIPVTIKNNTGVKLYQLYLYQAAQTDKGENLAEDIEYLDGYEMRNILNLYMTDEERLWHLEAIDQKGNVIESADVDFTGYGEDGVTINMEYSFDTMEGWLELQ